MTEKEDWHLFTRAVQTGVFAGPTEESIRLIWEAYVALPGRSAKQKGREFLDEYVDVALAKGNHDEARVCTQIRKELRAKNWDLSPHPRLEAKTKKYLELAGALQLAFGVLVTTPPEDIVDFLPVGWLDFLPSDPSDARTYRYWLVDNPDTRGPEPAVDDVSKQAARISLGRAPGTAGRPVVQSYRRKKAKK